MQYSKIFIINTLQVRGVTTFLYKLGIVNSKALSYANFYNYLTAQEATGYTRSEAIKLTANKFKVNRRSIYRAVKDMETPVQVTTEIATLLSQK
jgi:hypothetical protein